MSFSSLSSCRAFSSCRVFDLTSTLYPSLQKSDEQGRGKAGKALDVAHQRHAREVLHLHGLVDEAVRQDVGGADVEVAQHLAQHRLEA